jgi:hypothetical protein
MSNKKKALPMEELIAARRLPGDLPRKPPKKAPRLPKGPIIVKTRVVQIPIVRLPPRTWACMHGREAVCPHCVEGVKMRVQYAAALSQKPAPRVLRIDCWRASTDSNQRRAAGMEELKTSMAELQRQMILHAQYTCNGCVHCQEEELCNAKA